MSMDYTCQPTTASIQAPRCSVPLASLDVYEEDAMEALQRMNPSQQARPDGVQPAFLKMNIRNFLNWMTSFLLGHTQRVVFSVERSGNADIMLGIPQNSVLVPSFFNIFINDVTRTLRCTSLPYADSMAIRHPLGNQQLQKDLNDVVSWSDKNRHPLNNAKCTAMQISTSGQHRLTLPGFNLGGMKISRASSTRLIGVSLDFRFSFSIHIAEVASRARRILGFVTYLTQEEQEQRH
ncbi:hypothetical protein HPB47_009571 [Ixodes persulcatus]|uniref:Uncharacterized protein n=1 Tax=Ixodes persulcatus TaxID=34615 RepID=A0AC60P1U8_IXOPE|nr:hypothetical protein HPB47_009571 [Ixodes persulcatus]